MTPDEANTLLEIAVYDLDRYGALAIARAVEWGAGGRDRVAEAWSRADDDRTMYELLVWLGRREEAEEILYRLDCGCVACTIGRGACARAAAALRAGAAPVTLAQVAAARPEVAL